jgi:hypothetical protein
MPMPMDTDMVKKQLHTAEQPGYMVPEESWQTDFSEPPQGEIDAAWDYEINRRIQDVMTGKVELVPWEDVDRRADEVLSRIRAFKAKEGMASV